jgi:hypothetical protein
MALSPRAIDAMKAHAARGGPEGDIAARKLAAMGIPVGGGGSSGAARIASGGGGGSGGANVARHYPKPGNRVALPAGRSSGSSSPPMRAITSGSSSGPAGTPVSIRPRPAGTPVSIRPRPRPAGGGTGAVDEALRGADDLGRAAGNAAEKVVKQKSIFKGHGKGLLIGAGAAVVAGLAMNRRGSGTSSGKAGMTRY